MQRKELEQTRGEFIEQNKTMKRQRFENAFFNLLSLHKKILDNIEYTFKGEVNYYEAKGRGVFKVFYFGNDTLVVESYLKAYLKDHDIESFKRHYDVSIFNHYFHYVDGIINYIDKSELIDHQESIMGSVLCYAAWQSKELTP